MMSEWWRGRKGSCGADLKEFPGDVDDEVFFHSK